MNVGLGLILKKASGSWYVCFSTISMMIRKERSHYFDFNLPFETESKYLGLILDQIFSWLPYINTLCSKI